MNPRNENKICLAEWRREKVVGMFESVWDVLLLFIVTAELNCVRITEMKDAYLIMTLSVVPAR